MDGSEDDQVVTIVCLTLTVFVHFLCQQSYKGVKSGSVADQF